MSDAALEPSWTDRFADDVRAALGDEHRPRWASGSPCRWHGGTDQCCADCCTTCCLVEALDERRSASPECIDCGQPMAAHGPGLGQISERGCARVAACRRASSEGMVCVPVTELQALLDAVQNASLTIKGYEPTRLLLIAARRAVAVHLETKESK